MVDIGDEIEEIKVEVKMPIYSTIYHILEAKVSSIREAQILQRALMDYYKDTCLTYKGETKVKNLDISVEINIVGGGR